MFGNRSNIVVGLGGNLPFQGSPTATTLRKAVQMLASRDVVIRSVSRFYATPCFPAGAGPDYVNAAVALETSLSPERLLDRMHEVEAAFQRERIQRWGMRTLDADLLAFDQLILPDLTRQSHWRDLPAAEQIRATPDELILPHPRLQDRAFALVPMADVAPDWVHPVLKVSVRALCAALPEDERAAVRPI
ncbi:2-amino-4-hydroxy-6-hydroxymethyldihydropteridine diphosphokinase [Sedimentitalea todarodis]|uniref:2-amino-4-hydroxy-6-hydroxymethyldihydropteridine pyrophosphokinase n=1 Tax=Sedimentitalea todarodis TaxID=1631240 RepID=A0ABU3V9U4_9RHOB|nr:2-amino-4-hydroxy-6-hydroxymethyldihydropteridine diphosphokinase [Sedimentitalea todarodis]MDU9002800.1 2-amino-4-hydroxy-6-hydroxymethyldihydropteridine diphosphokinase [Sedimentitalea todarodis]